MRSVAGFIVALVALLVFFLIDDVLYYLLFERLFGLRPGPALKWMTAVIFVLLNLGVAVPVLRALRRPPQTGGEGLIDAYGVVTEAIDRSGWVRVHGELWRATADRPIGKGQKVKVVARDGLLLQVQSVGT